MIVTEFTHASIHYSSAAAAAAAAADAFTAWTVATLSVNHHVVHVPGGP